MYCWWKCKNGAAAVENSLAVPQKLNTEFPYNQAILRRDIYREELKAGVQTDTCMKPAHHNEE